MASGVDYALRSLAEHVEVIGIQPVCYEHAGLVVEPSAALGVAAVLEDLNGSPGGTSARSCAVVTWRHS
jgi:hypothetical protein